MPCWPRSAPPVTRAVPPSASTEPVDVSTSTKHVCESTLEKLMGASGGMVIAGAADQCALVVAHATVPRRHARLSLAGEALQVEDLGSTNGTAVGGKALRAGEPVVLHAGNKLRLGDVDLLVRQL